MTGMPGPRDTDPPDGSPMGTTGLLEELHRLPVRQGTSVRVLQLLDDPDVSVEEVARHIEADPALSTRVLRLANSPFFARSGSEASAARAVFLLGLSVVRSLAVATAAGLFDARSKHLPPGFWDHAIAVAAGATVLARYLDVDRGDAFSAGVLHDIGEALVCRHAPTEYAEILRQLRVRPEERIAAEQAFLQGLSHADVGAIALQGWRMPERLVVAVRDHHDPVGRDADALTRAVVAGDAIADRLLDDPTPHHTTADLAATLVAAGVQASEHDDVVAAVAAETDQLRASLGC